MSESRGRAGFDESYEAYKDVVLRTALLYTRNQHAAEEITQNVFLKFYIYMEHTNVENVKAWLITTTKNLAFNYVRNHQREVPVDMEENGDSLCGIVDSIDDTYFRRLEEREAARLYDSILDALFRENERWYEAVTLTYCLDKPQKEVADCMGIPLNSLHSMLYRARNWIKKRYESEYYQSNTGEK